MLCDDSPASGLFVLKNIVAVYHIIVDILDVGADGLCNVHRPKVRPLHNELVAVDDKVTLLFRRIEPLHHHVEQCVGHGSLGADLDSKLAVAVLDLLQYEPCALHGI